MFCDSQWQRTEIEQQVSTQRARHRTGPFRSITCLFQARSDVFFGVRDSDSGGFQGSGNERPSREPHFILVSVVCLKGSMCGKNNGKMCMSRVMGWSQIDSTECVTASALQRVLRDDAFRLLRGFFFWTACVSIQKTDPTAQTARACGGARGYLLMGSDFGRESTTEQLIKVCDESLRTCAFNATF